MERVELAVRGVVGAHLSDRLLRASLHVALISSLFSHLTARPHLGLCDCSCHLICWGESLFRLALRPGALLDHVADRGGRLQKLLVGGGQHRGRVGLDISLLVYTILIVLVDRHAVRELRLQLHPPAAAQTGPSCSERS